MKSVLVFSTVGNLVVWLLENALTCPSYSKGPTIIHRTRSQQVRLFRSQSEAGDEPLELVLKATMLSLCEGARTKFCMKRQVPTLYMFGNPVSPRHIITKGSRSYFTLNLPKSFSHLLLLLRSPFSSESWLGNRLDSGELPVLSEAFSHRKARDARFSIKTQVLSRVFVAQIVCSIHPLSHLPLLS
jgi:hypothetical protein